MVLEIKGKFLYFKRDKEDFGFVRIDNIISCFDTANEECEITYVSNSSYFDVDVLNHSAKDVLDILCKRRRPDGRKMSKL